MAGTITCGTLSDGTNSTSSTNCIRGSAKAWVNFVATSSSSAINSSYNVSSITKNTTGDYTINFTNAFANANYVFAGGTSGNSTSPGGGWCMTVKDPSLWTASSIRVVNGVANNQYDVIGNASLVFFSA